MSLIRKIFCLFFPVLLVTVAEADDGLVKEAREELVRFTEAVIAGPEQVAPLLAPEYQIMRSNGVGYDRDGYLETGVGSLSFKPVYSHEELVVTRDADIMVVRYFLDIDEKIDGVPITRRAPRLTVFRRIGDHWRVVAHSNFARHE